MAVVEDRIYLPTDALILPKPRRHYRVGLRCEHWQLRSQIGASSSRFIFYVAGPNNTQVHRLDTVTHESEILKILSFSPRGLVANNGWISCGGENGECVAFQVDEPSETINQRQPQAAPAPAPAPAPTDSAMYPLLRHYVDHGGPRSNDVLDAFRDAQGPPVWPATSADERPQRRQDPPPDERAQPPLEDPSDDSDSTADSMPALMPSHNNIPAFDSTLRVPVLRAPRETARPSSASHAPHEANANHKNLVARSKCFGNERINCITLWFPPTSIARRCSGAYSQPVAVLANNDRHVTVVELESQEAIDKVTYPDYVNRALISPDGQLLVAICDDPYLYVHERVPRQGGGFIPWVRPGSLAADFEWKLCAQVHLKSQRKEDVSDQRGSFAVCFSNTGNYLAVGTQYGTISVFDTAAFQKPGSNPLITTFNTTRPKEDVGAVRDMAFCPGPFDLLAWTEHRGRVGVADIRDNYISRQILTLDKYDDFEQIMVAEKGSIDPRLLTRADDGELTLTVTEAAPTGASATRRLAVPEADPAATTRRLARRLTTERATSNADAATAPARDFHPPLGADETMVLEALSAHRRRRDNLESSRNELRDRWANMPTTEGRFGERASNPVPIVGMGDLARLRVQAQQERQRQERLREASDRVRARRLLDQVRGLHATDPTTTTTLTPAERNFSVTAVLRTFRAPDNPDGARYRRWNGPTATVDLAQALDHDWDILADGDRPEDADATARDYLASVWSTIVRNRGEDAAEAPAAPTTTAATQPAREARTRPRGAQRFANATARAATASSRCNHEHDDTAGLAWSEDGRVLFIGADDGLYEFHVNMLSRKLFSSIELR